MLGLFGALRLGTRALAAQRQGVEVAGHNLANVNNTAYARQRVSIQSTASSDGLTDPVGSGVEVVAIRQIRDRILDGQVIAEGGVSGSLEAQQRALKTAQSLLGQSIDRGNTGAGGTSAADGVGGGQQLAAGLTDFFNSFASLAAQPASIPEREITLRRAAALAAQFPALDNRLSILGRQLDESSIPISSRPMRSCPTSLASMDRSRGPRSSPAVPPTTCATNVWPSWSRFPESLGSIRSKPPTVLWRLWLAVSHWSPAMFGKRLWKRSPIPTAIG